MLLFTKIIASYRRFHFLGIYEISLLFFIFNSLPTYGAAEFNGIFSKSRPYATTITVSKFIGNNLVILKKFEIQKGEKSFYFKIENECENGYYRIQSSPKNYCDIILSEGIKPEIKFKDTLLSEWKTVENSKENTLIIQAKEIAKGLNGEENINKILELCKKNIETFFAKSTMLYLPKRLLFDPALCSQSDKNCLLASFLNSGIINDICILRSTAYPNFINEALREYSEPTLDGIKNIAILLMESSAFDFKLKDFTAHYLINLFSKIGPQQLIGVIYETYYRSENDLLRLETEYPGITELIGQQNQIQVGSISPDFNDLELFEPGKLHQFSTTWKNNKFTILYFWDSQCDFCIEKISILNQLSSTLKNNSIALVYYSIDDDENLLKEFITSNSIIGTHLRSENGTKSNTCRKFGINKVPTIFVIDPQGYIIAIDPEIEDILSLIE